MLPAMTVTAGERPGGADPLAGRSLRGPLPDQPDKALDVSGLGDGHAEDVLPGQQEVVVRVGEGGQRHGPGSSIMIVPGPRQAARRSLRPPGPVVAAILPSWMASVAAGGAPAAMVCTVLASTMRSALLMVALRWLVPAVAVAQQHLAMAQLRRGG